MNNEIGRRVNVLFLRSLKHTGVDTRDSAIRRARRLERRRFSVMCGKNARKLERPGVSDRLYIVRTRIGIYAIRVGRSAIL